MAFVGCRDFSTRPRKPTSAERLYSAQAAFSLAQFVVNRQRAGLPPLVRCTPARAKIPIAPDARFAAPPAV
jgi:hypothetical protein